jgi:ankyrin repeat protein
MRASCISAGLICILSILHAQTGAETFFQAIRAGDASTLRTLSAGSVNVKDKLDTTPLHYAAIYGNTESVRILLEHGADPNARNKSGVTPLIFAAYDFEKTKLLVEKGADVNARSAKGMTPILVATSVYGNTATVRYLLEKGASAKAASADDDDPLQNAASKGDTEMVRLLLAKGADPHRVDQAGQTALFDSLFAPDPERVKILIDAGSNVNVANTFAGKVKNGPIDLIHMTPVFLAAPDAPPTIVRALLVAGARADEPDQRKLTPLTVAVCTDTPKLETIRMLIAAHADVNAKDRNGESVLDWALKYKNPEVLAILKSAGAQPAKPYTPPQRPADFAAGSPKDAVMRSTALLVKSEQTFFAEGGGCMGCHHQPLGARAYAAVKASYGTADEHLRQSFLDAMIARRPRMLTNLPLEQASGGGDFDELLAMTEALAELGEPASPSTDAILHYLAARQSVAGGWILPGGPRAPLESSDITRTAMAIRAIKTYEWPAQRAEFEERIARARAWLQAARPVTQLEEADRIMGLKVAGVPARELEKSAQALIKDQHADGGWSQTPFLESDAYATGTVLATLYQNGFLKPADPSYARGVAFLLKTQFPDGAWYVRSRGPKLQPYFQSAFPFDHDQWISAAATALAVMALAPAR